MPTFGLRYKPGFGLGIWLESDGLILVFPALFETTT